MIMTLDDILNLIPEGVEVCVTCSDLTLTGTMESMQSLLSDTTLKMKVINIEARSDVIWIWLSDPGKIQEDS